MKKKDFQALVRYLNDQAKPLSPKELIARAIDSGIIDPQGYPIDAYLELEWPDMHRRIEEHIDDATHLGQRPKIKYLPDIDRLVPGSFVSRTEAVQPKHLKEAIKIRLGRSIADKLYKELDDYQFQEFCARFLGLLGCINCEVQPRGPDGGIDFSGTFHTPLSKIVVIGQAKHNAKNNIVSDGEVKKLYATVSREKTSCSEPALYLGALITTSSFSPQAYRFAKSVDLPVCLIDGHQLVMDLIERNVGIDYSVPTNIQMDRRNPLEWFS